MAERINRFDIRKGTIYKFNDELLECVDVERIVPSLFTRGIGHIELVAKKIQKGVFVKQQLYPIDYIEAVIPEEQKMEFLYDDGESLCFMDTNTYDTSAVSNDKFKWEKNFLTTGMQVSCCVYSEEIIKVILPDDVCLTIVSFDESDSSTPSKCAVCETGLKVNVPIFAHTGDQIIVSTSDGTYKGRA